MKKIGIDARFYGPKGKGLGRYAQKLIEHLEKIDGHSDRQYYVFLRKDNFDEYQPVAPNFRKVLADYSWYGFDEQIKFPWFLRRFNLDLIHFCHFNVPFFYRRKYVVTIHDLILFHYPTIRNTTLNRYFYYFKLLAYKLVIGNAAQESRRIIAVSHFTKEDIVANLNVEEKKVVVTHEGCDLKCIADPPQIQDAILKKYGIIKPYLLYVGNAYPHKNLESLCRAFQLIKKEFPRLNLVLCGGIDYFYKRLEKFVEQQAIEGVIFAGFVKDRDLDTIYRNSQLYVFPSLYEGFGLPPLEAAAKGVPVACSGRTSIEEVMGRAAMYFDPEDEQQIAQTVCKLLSSCSLKQELIRCGIERLGKFNWHDMARQTLQTYLDVI